MASVVLFISVMSNISLIIMKLFAGFLCNSKSLIADGFHSLSDLSTDIIAVVGNYFSKKPADKNHPYGHGKINYITSVLIGIFIILMGISLFKNSFNSSYTTTRKITILVVVATIIIKLIVSRLLIVTGKKENNNILISSGKESFSDVFSSILVLISLILGLFSNKVELFKYMDTLGSIIISVIIIVVGIKILIENISSLIGQVEISPKKKEEVLDYLNNKFNITIKDIILLKYGHYYQAFLKIKVNKSIKVMDLENKIKVLKNSLLNSDFKIKYVHIDFEVGSEKNARVTRSGNSKKNSKKESSK